MCMPEGFGYYCYWGATLGFGFGYFKVAKVSVSDFMGSCFCRSF